jgi:hypothetical protein
MPNPNLKLLVDAARLLTPILDELVFVGGCTTALLLAVVDGREELAGEIQTAKIDVRSYLSKEIRQLVDTRGFLDALPGHLAPDPASQERITIVTARLRNIAGAS